MNYSLIDIGSNSIRLTVYEINGSNFKPLFHSKIMAGLAGYVEKGKLSKSGIEAAKSALLDFKNILVSLSLEQVSVFATASLRNIKNTDAVLKQLQEVSGFHIELINEQEEALLSYHGARLEFPEIIEGTFADIGGASTEIISFSENDPTHIASYKIGSLNLYKNYVKRILPGKKSLTNISNAIMKVLLKNTTITPAPNAPLICVGGTARATMKIARKLYHLPQDCNILTKTQVDDMFHLLTRNNKKSIRMILRLSPDRIHTIIPGLFILKNILLIYNSEKLIVSNYGIREGFLCKKIIQSNKITTNSPKTEN